ncbi:hypothetical protein KM043_003144 [Ampulex compressa]|nr:hypothetical protein KM043_003144 [Ampulex compressa]
MEFELDGSLKEWVKDKPLSILQLDPADRAVLRIAESVLPHARLRSHHYRSYKCTWRYVLRPTTSRTLLNLSTYPSARSAISANLSFQLPSNCLLPAFIILPSIDFIPGAKRMKGISRTKKEKIEERDFFAPPSSPPQL